MGRLPLVYHAGEAKNGVQQRLYAVRNLGSFFDEVGFATAPSPVT